MAYPQVPNSDDPTLTQDPDEPKMRRGWDRVVYKCKTQPLVPLGALATVLAFMGAARMGYKKNSMGMQYFFRARVAAQAFTVLALWGGLYVWEDERKDRIWKNREKAEKAAKAKHDAWLAALDAANEAHLANQKELTLAQRLKLQPPPPVPEDPGPEPELPAPQFKRYEYSLRNPVTGVVNVQPILHYKFPGPENATFFPTVPWIQQKYKEHADRIWAADKWRKQEEEKIKKEKLAKERSVVGQFWGAVGEEQVKRVELDESEVSTEALLRRAAMQKPSVERPVLSDPHRRINRRDKTVNSEGGKDLGKEEDGRKPQKK